MGRVCVEMILPAVRPHTSEKHLSFFEVPTQEAAAEALSVIVMSLPVVVDNEAKLLVYQHL